MDPATIAMIAQIGMQAMQSMKGEKPPAIPGLPNATDLVSMTPQFTGAMMASSSAAPPPTQSTVEPPSAHGRTLEDVYNQMTPAATVTAQDPLTEVPPSLSPNSAEGVPPALDPGYTGAPTAPTTPPGDGQFMGMNPLQLAQLGLMLSSTMFQPKQGPPPPGLPGNSFSPMRPVFMGGMRG